MVGVDLTPIAPLPQHLAFALTEPTFGKKAQGQDAGAMGGGNFQRGLLTTPFFLLTHGTLFYIRRSKYIC